MNDTSMYIRGTSLIADFSELDSTKDFIGKCKSGITLDYAFTYCDLDFNESRKITFFDFCAKIMSTYRELCMSYGLEVLNNGFTEKAQRIYDIAHLLKMFNVYIEESYIFN